MIIEINEAVRVRKMDTLNWVIERRGTKKGGGLGAWKTTGYYTRVESALSALWREACGVEGSFTLGAAVERLSDLGDRLVYEAERAMNPGRQGIRPDLRIWPDPDNIAEPSAGDEVRGE